MAAPLIFWLDEGYDREHAPDRVSRFGAAVRERPGEFAGTWDDISPVPFAVAAWRLATSLTPAYVRWHRRVTAAACLSSPWDGSLLCDVSVVAPWPAELTRTRAWCRDRGWRDWPQLFGQYAAPSAPAGPEDDAPGTARRAVAAVTRELNDLLAPMIGQLEAATPAR